MPPIIVPRVLFRARDLEGIAAGRIDLAFRRWERARVKPGTRIRTAVGVIAIDAVDVVDDVTEEDVRRAGLASRAEALGDGRPGRLHRIELHLAGPDPRIALRDGEPTADDFARIDRLPWALDYLRAIAERPGVRAADLAESFGIEKRLFKPRVRRLKELGLTESLERGYRLSPRGRALVDQLPRRVGPSSS
jgi:hypothetical protein